jgi:hypothetical protein
LLIGSSFGADSVCVAHNVDKKTRCEVCSQRGVSRFFLLNLPMQESPPRIIVDALLLSLLVV